MRVDPGDPFRLLHAVEIRHVEPQRESMLGRQRDAVPRVGEHRARVGANRLERTTSKNPSADVTFRCVADGFSASAADLLQAHAGPARRADQVAAWWIGNTTERREDCCGSSASNVGQHQRLLAVDKAANREPPAIAVNCRRARVRIDAIKVFDRCELGHACPLPASHSASAFGNA